ncbi:hypothetical protein NECID01_0271 [Nematocida sp. AWRm77]|nr:hypothetical protein NECID01_0271 [Nematocida sp. AWRm77]
MGSLLEFLNKAKDTSNTIAGLSEYVHAASTLKAKAAIASEAEYEDIALVMKSIRRDFKAGVETIKTDLSRMKEESTKHHAEHGHDRSFSARASHLQSLARRLGLIVEDFRRVQNGLAKYERDRLKEQYLIAKPHATVDELSALEEQDRAKPMLQSIFTIGTKSAKDVIIKAERRRSSIEEILKGMTDLKDLSDDFATYVVSNSTEVDRIYIDVKQSLGQAKKTEGMIEKVAARKIRIQKAKKITTVACGVFLCLAILYVLAKVRRAL